MTFPQSLGSPLVKPIPVSAGGTGSTTVPNAQAGLDVPSLSGNNSFTGATNDFGGNVGVYGDVTVDAGTVTLNGTLGNANIQLNKSGSLIFFDPASAPKLASISANPTNTRLLVIPDVSGNFIVSGDSPATGSILYFNGTAWKCLAAPGDALAHTLTITSGVLSWV